MQRFHALDSLRASMMLLGVWLHAVVGYSRNGGWPYKDAHPTAVYDWTLGIIHAFRMPLFFLLAGFFGALLWERGRAQFVRNRLSRILAPFALFWTLMFPAILWAAAYSQNWQHADGIQRANRFLLSGKFLEMLHPLHMWFLEYLLILYAIGFGVVRALEIAAGSPAVKAWFDRLNSVYRTMIAGSWRRYAVCVPSALVLLTMPGGYLQDPPNFIPVPRIVAAYLIPFFFGWLLHRNRDLVPDLRRNAWWQIGAAVLLVVTWETVVGPHQNRPENWHWVKPLRSVAVALLMWLLSFGLIGLFLRYLGNERPFGRYMADGSYWIYLMHMPVLVIFQMGLASFRWDSAIKVPLVIVLSVPVLVLTYDLLVRDTWIGVLLNGRRYDRWFFKATSEDYHASVPVRGASSGFGR